MSGSPDSAAVECWGAGGLAVLARTLVGAGVVAAKELGGELVVAGGAVPGVGVEDVV